MAKRALVIDDSRAMRTILGGILTDLGFAVTDAEDGERALETLRRCGPFELALVDWNMPLMSGFDFVCVVRRDSEFDGMRLMMVTTETEIERMADALEAGADEYIMKPFSKEMLLEKLKLLGIGPKNH
ncbi:MAG: response regulator [Thermoanaerobaculales bacterium]|nr:response regulator [Thermoanaerobaculales bacterium]